MSKYKIGFMFDGYYKTTIVDASSKENAIEELIIKMETNGFNLAKEWEIVNLNKVIERQNLFSKKINNVENQYGVTIDFDVNNIHDENHLESIWYGGAIGSISYKEYKVIISSFGEIRLHGTLNGEEISYADKNESGNFYEEYGHLLTDETLGEHIADNTIEITDSNWFQFDIYDPDGNWIDIGDINTNVIDVNIIECFTDVEKYIQIIDEHIQLRQEPENTMESFRKEGFKIIRDGKTIVLTPEEMSDFRYLDKAVKGQNALSFWIDALELRIDEQELNEILNDEEICFNVRDTYENTLTDESGYIESDVVGDIIKNIKAETYREAIDYYSNETGINIENDHVRKYAYELCYCYEHGECLMDFDCWTRYEELMEEKLTFEEYKAIDCDFDLDPHDVTPENKEVLDDWIKGWRTSLEKYRNEHCSLDNAIENSENKKEEYNAKSSSIIHKEDLVK